MSESKCPVMHTAGGGPSNRDWWPSQLRLGVLRRRSSLSNPMGEDFNYAKEFKSLDLKAVKKDLRALMTFSVSEELFTLRERVGPTLPERAI